MLLPQNCRYLDITILTKQPDNGLEVVSLVLFLKSFFVTHG
jgi:hypothetical protein